MIYAYRIVVVAMMMWKLMEKIVDIEKAFLHGDLDEKIFMKCPKGLKISNEKCLKLNK